MANDPSKECAQRAVLPLLIKGVSISEVTEHLSNGKSPEAWNVECDSPDIVFQVMSNVRQ